MQDKTYLLAFCGPPIKSSKWERHQAAVAEEEIMWYFLDLIQSLTVRLLLFSCTPLPEDTKHPHMILKEAPYILKQKQTKKPTKHTTKKKLFEVFPQCLYFAFYHLF